MSKSVNAKINIDNLIKLLFFIGTSVVSFITIFYVILGAFHATGFQTPFIFLILILLIF